MYIGMRGHDFDTNTLDALCEKCKEYGSACAFEIVG